MDINNNNTHTRTLPLAFGPLAVGPSFFIVWAWTRPGSATLFHLLAFIVAMTFIL